MDYGSAVQDIIVKENLEDIEFKKYGYPDEFIKHGSVAELEKKYDLDVEGIVKDLESLQIDKNYVNI